MTAAESGVHFTDRTEIPKGRDCVITYKVRSRDYKVIGRIWQYRFYGQKSTDAQWCFQIEEPGEPTQSGTRRTLNEIRATFHSRCGMVKEALHG